VSAGQVVRITQRGKPIADLTPIASDELGLVTAAAQKMLALMKSATVQDNLNIKSLINTGRD
jgi:antitoxin (DNA-binding transcriptional repressor) of toxin-antitoxin stability system